MYLHIALLYPRRLRHQIGGTFISTNSIYLFQYFALYTQLENMPGDADDELDIDGGGAKSFGVKLSSKSDQKSAAAPKIKRKGRKLLNQSRI